MPEHLSVQTTVMIAKVAHKIAHIMRPDVYSNSWDVEDSTKRAKFFDLVRLMDEASGAIDDEADKKATDGRTVGGPDTKTT